MVCLGEDLVVEEAARVEIKAPGELVQEDVQMMEDGSAVINPGPMTPSQGEFGVNLAEIVPEGELSTLANDLFGNYEEDRSSRGDWEKAYVDGLDLLGFKYDNRTEPFKGASGATHPVLAEAVTQFQAGAYKELLPPSGPVRTQILGKITRERQDEINIGRNYISRNVGRRNQR